MGWSRYEVYCIEYSEIGCDLIRENLKAAGIKGEIYNQDIFNNDLKSESFDIIFSAGFIEHFDDPSPILSEFDRLLKKDGYIITTIPNENGLVGLLQRIANKEILDTLIPHTLEDMKYYHHNFFKILYASYFGSFNLGVVNWGNRLPKIMGYVSYVINMFVWYILKRIPISIDSRYISPYIENFDLLLFMPLQ